MLEKFLNIFKIPDLRKRIGFTLGLLAIYRLGAHIPTPGIDAAKLQQFFNQNAGGALGLLDLFNGGNLRKLTVFALGIMPYITASIIFQLLTVIYEPLAKLQKEGRDGSPQDYAVDPLRYCPCLPSCRASSSVSHSPVAHLPATAWSP